MSKIKNFKDFLNEASLRGNIGIPGEEGSGRESWMDKITSRSNTAAREFAMQNRADIQNFESLIQQSKRLQRGHEEELSQLTVDAFRELYGYLLEDIDLDFKIITGNEANQMMQETPTESEEVELDELEDKEIIDQVHKRKILRTIQQGKGLSSKAILNLSIFKDGLVDILGQENAAEYLRVLNKISNVMQFFDWDMPIEIQKQMWQARQGAAGSCDIQFPKEKIEDKEDAAQKVLDDLANGEDITDNPDAEDLISGLNIKLIALGVDLSVLIHEGIKAVYKLITQAALEALYGETAETVLLNTDSLFDELEEIKYGRQMQDAFFKIVINHPEVDRRIQQMMRNDTYSDVEITAFQERLNYLFFAEISQLGAEKASEMLEVVNAILSESPEAAEICDPLIRRALRNVAQGAEYEASKKKPAQPMEMPSMEAPSREEAPMSKQEIQRALDAALDARDYAEAARLGRMLGESVKINRRYRKQI